MVSCATSAGANLHVCRVTVLYILDKLGNVCSCDHVSATVCDIVIDGNIVPKRNLAFILGSPLSPFFGKFTEMCNCVAYKVCLVWQGCFQTEKKLLKKRYIFATSVTLFSVILYIEIGQTINQTICRNIFWCKDIQRK